MRTDKKVSQENLSTKEIEILSRVSYDPFYFSRFVWVKHPIKGKAQFDLYPFQKSVLFQLVKNQLNIIKKFRQAGITELIAMYCLWLGMYHSNKNIQIISIKDRVAKRVLKRMKYIYQNLPPYLRVKVVNGRGRGDIGSTSEIEFANGSLITSLPTTEDSGRSEALSLLVIDEAAIVKWANTIWGAAQPTVSTGGNVILNSTPYGIGNFYHNMWVDACSGGNGFVPIDLKWQMHPERDLAWYKSQRDQLGPRRTAQEIDGDFLTSGHSVFDLVDIKAIEDELPYYDIIETRYNGSLKIFEKPKKGKKYWIGADISTGRARDYSTFTIYDRQGEEHAVFKGKIPVGEFAELLMEMGKRYNYAELAPESNDIGLAVTQKIQDANYPNLYYSKKLVRKKGEKKPTEQNIPGWYTTEKTRPVIIHNLEEDIRKRLITIKDPFFVQEAYTFIYDSSNRPVAMGKHKNSVEDELLDDSPSYSDDAILGKAISNHVRKGKIKTLITLPQ